MIAIGHPKRDHQGALISPAIIRASYIKEARAWCRAAREWQHRPDRKWRLAHAAFSVGMARAYSRLARELRAGRPVTFEGESGSAVCSCAECGFAKLRGEVS